MSASARGDSRGGARRTAVVSCPQKLQTFLNSVFEKAESNPFDMGVYNTLKVSQACSGSGLVAVAAYFIGFIESVSSKCEINAKTFTDLLMALVGTPVFAKFAPGLYDKIEITDPLQCRLWCSRVVNRHVVVLAHLRRLRGNVDKKMQCFRLLDQKGRQVVSGILAKIVTDDIASSEEDDGGEEDEEEEEEESEEEPPQNDDDDDDDGCDQPFDRTHHEATPRPSIRVCSVERMHGIKMSMRDMRAGNSSLFAEALKAMTRPLPPTGEPEIAPTSRSGHKKAVKKRPASHDDVHDVHPVFGKMKLVLASKTSYFSSPLTTPKLIVQIQEKMSPHHNMIVKALYRRCIDEQLDKAQVKEIRDAMVKQMGT